MQQRIGCLCGVVLALVACSDPDETTAGASTTTGAGGSAASSTSSAGGATATATSSSSSAGGSTGSTTASSSGSGASGPTGCTASGLALIDAINDYRDDNGLGPIPASSSLCIVAEAHVDDLRDNAPHQANGCNLHSWSDQGAWTACCYTSDHAQAQCMWDKPSELTSYTSNGYEISYGGSSSPDSAVSAWSGSSGHNAVILNQGSWANQNWQAIGAAQHDGYAHVWFGAAADSN